MKIRCRGGDRSASCDRHSRETQGVPETLGANICRTTHSGGAYLLFSHRSIYSTKTSLVPNRGSVKRGRHKLGLLNTVPRHALYLLLGAAAGHKPSATGLRDRLLGAQPPRRAPLGHLLLCLHDSESLRRVALPPTSAPLFTICIHEFND